MVHSGEENVGQVCVDYYCKLFTQVNNASYPEANFVKTHVTRQCDELNDLIVEVLPEEIKQTLWEINPNKAPGPDGFNGLFFRHNWATIRDTVTKAIREFFSSSSFLKQLNTTSFALVPKVKNPMLLKDF